MELSASSQLLPPSPSSPSLLLLRRQVTPPQQQQRWRRRRRWKQLRRNTQFHPKTERRGKEPQLPSLRETAWQGVLVFTHFCLSALSFASLLSVQTGVLFENNQPTDGRLKKKSSRVKSHPSPAQMKKTDINRSRTPFTIPVYSIVCAALLQHPAYEYSGVFTSIVAEPRFWTTVVVRHVAGHGHPRQAPKANVGLPDPRYNDYHIDAENCM